MKKLFLSILLILLLAFPAYAEDTQMARLSPAMMGSVPAATAYTWTLVGTRTGYVATTNGTTVATSSTIDINEGDTLVAWVYAQDMAYSGDHTISISDGTNAFTEETPVQDADTSGFATWGIVTSAANNDTATFTATFGVATHDYRSIVVYVLRKSGGTVSKDAMNLTGSLGSSTAPLSGNINTVANAFVIGAYGMGQILTPSNRLLNDAPPTNNVDATSSSTWYMNFEDAVTNNHAQATEDSSNYWMAGIYSVKVE